MRNLIGKTLIIFSILLLFGNNIYPQSLSIPNLSLKNNYPHKSMSEVDEATFIAAFIIMVATPTVIYENKKVYFGLSRELSLLLGKKGELRMSADYTFVFRRDLKHQFRVILKYDILSKLSRGDWFDDRSFFSFGTGYFIDADGSGIPAEISAGFRIGEDSHFYLYPYIKLRHTFMTKKEKPDNTDFSLGLAIGFKPF
jgi:hypothetical protein